MSNKTIFKTAELRRDYKDGIVEMLDQKKNIESVIISYDVGDKLNDTLKEIDEHIAYIEKLIKEIPDQVKVREKDPISHTLLMSMDDFIKEHFYVSENIINAIMPYIKDAKIDTNEVNQLIDTIKTEVM